MTNENNQRLHENLTCEFKRKNSFTLSKSCMKTEQFLLTVKSSLYPQLNSMKELDHKTKDKLTSLRIRCGFLAKCLSSGWETVRRQLSTSCLNGFSELWRRLLTSPGCCLTLASSLDVEQVRFVSWSVYLVLLGNDLSNLSAVSVSFTKVQCLQFSSSKVRRSRFLGNLLGSLLAFYFVQSVFCNAVAIRLFTVPYFSVRS